MEDKYRRGVGIFLINRKSKLWVGKRTDHRNKYWQMPQGGIDANETPEVAMRRELMEETGLKENYEILGKTKRWLKYKLPNDLVNVVWNGKYTGQKQLWFACRFFGEDDEINLNNCEKPEFYKWKWIDPKKSIDLIVPFKKEMYNKILNDFKSYIC